MRFAIFTSGHSGSNWLAKTIDRRDAGVAVFHEPVHEIAPHVVEQTYASRIPPAPQLLRDLSGYVDWLRRREAQFEVVGEIHVGAWAFWTDVEHLLPPHRYALVRHPIQVVHSLARNLLHHGTPGELKWALGLAAPSHATLPLDQRLFAGVCSVWAQQRETADRLGIRESFRLEDLTSSPDVLASACTRITGKPYAPAMLQTVLSRRVNRKIQGDNSPENLFWNLWSDWMRDTFLRPAAPV